MSALVLINILKLFLNSIGIVLGMGRSSSRPAACGGVGFLISSMIEPSLMSTTYGDLSVLKGSPFSSDSGGPRMFVGARDAFVVENECSCAIVTRTKLDAMMTRSNSNMCSLLDRYATTNLRSESANVDSILRCPTKSSMSDGPFAAPNIAWPHTLGKLKTRTMRYQYRRVFFV